MIKVMRSPEPALLKENTAKWTAALLKATTKARKEIALAHYRHPDIRDALELMFHGKCAYCESKILHVTFAHIEHYCPKSTDLTRTFDWTNLLLACPRCNQAPNKGTQFPDASEGGPLLNPCEDDPALHLKFLYNPQDGVTSVVGKTRRGRTTWRVLGLNRRDLRKRRSEQLVPIAYIAARAVIDPEARELLVQFAQSDREYAAFARALLAQTQ